MSKDTYIKAPEEVIAVQWKGDNLADFREYNPKFTKDTDDEQQPFLYGPDGRILDVGDWIVFYPNGRMEELNDEYFRAHFTKGPVQ